MFLIKTDVDQRRKWKQTIKKDDKAYQFYTDLMYGKYDIYVSYQASEQELLYEALGKEDGFGYHSLRVDASRMISDLNDEVEKPLAQAFACYIYERECEKTEEELKEIYGPLYEVLSPLFL